jgi:hypothetical protein
MRRLTVAVMAGAACWVEPFPVDLTIASEGASNPTVSIAPDGTVLAAWVATRSDTSDVFLTRVGADGRAVTPIRVNDVVGDAAPHEQAPAQVVVGPDGIVHVVWTTNTPIPGRRFPASDLRYARSTDGGLTFAPTVTVNDDVAGPPSSHTFHDVAAGKDGLVVISWLDGRVSDSMRLAEPGVSEDHLPGSDIRVAISFDAGVSFVRRAVVDTNVCPCCRTSLALGANGGIHVAWRKVFSGDVRDIVVATSHDAGESFDPPVRVHGDNWIYRGCPHAGPDLTTDLEGQLHVAWYTGAPHRAGLYHAVSADGGMTFGSPTALAESQPPSQAKVAVDGTGVIWMAWELRGEGGGDRIVSDWFDIGAWRPDPVTVGTGRSPALAAAGGRRAIAWLGESGFVRVRIGPE